MKAVWFAIAVLALCPGCQPSIEEQQRILENSRERTDREKFNDAYDDAYESSRNLIEPAMQ